MKPAGDLDDHGDMDAELSAPHASDRTNLRRTALHPADNVVGSPSEVLGHRVAHVAPTGKQGQSVDFMPDKPGEAPAIQSRRASPAVLVGSAQVFFEHLDVPKAGSEVQGVLAAWPGKIDQVEVASIELDASPLHEPI